MGCFSLWPAGKADYQTEANQLYAGATVTLYGNNKKSA